MEFCIPHYPPDDVCFKWIFVFCRIVYRMSAADPPWWNCHRIVDSSFIYQQAFARLPARLDQCIQSPCSLWWIDYRGLPASKDKNSVGWIPGNVSMEEGSHFRRYIIYGNILPGLRICTFQIFRFCHSIYSPLHSFSTFLGNFLRHLPPGCRHRIPGSVHAANGSFPLGNYDPWVVFPGPYTQDNFQPGSPRRVDGPIRIAWIFRHFIRYVRSHLQGKMRTRNIALWA